MQIKKNYFDFNIDINIKHFDALKTTRPIGRSGRPFIIISKVQDKLNLHDFIEIKMARQQLLSKKMFLENGKENKTLVFAYKSS